MILGLQIWISIPNDFGQYYSSLHNSLFDATMVLSFATNAITTMLIAYKLWYVTVGGTHLIMSQNEVLLQELPNIRHEHSRLEEAKKSSADRNDSSRRIRSCLLHNPCLSLYTLADMYAQDLQSSHRSNRCCVWLWSLTIFPTSKP